MQRFFSQKPQQACQQIETLSCFHNFIQYLCQDNWRCKDEQCKKLHPKCFKRLCIESLLENTSDCPHSNCDLKHLTQNYLRNEYWIAPIKGCQFNFQFFDDCGFHEYTNANIIELSEEFMNIQSLAEFKDRLKLKTQKKRFIFETKQFQDQDFLDGVTSYVYQLGQNKIVKLLKIVVDTYDQKGEITQKLAEEAEKSANSRFLSQSIAYYMAKQFNEQTQSIEEAPIIYYVQPYILELDEPFKGVKTLYAEDYINNKDIKWNKYTDNNDYADPKSYCYTSFSHFTYVQSGGEFVITDLQGKLNYLSDPAIHTLQENIIFDEANLGKKGLMKFINEQHQLCSVVCQKLNIQKFGCQVDQSKWNYKEVIFESNRRHQIIFDLKIKLILSAAQNMKHQFKNFFHKFEFYHQLLLFCNREGKNHQENFLLENKKLIQKVLKQDLNFLLSQFNQLRQSLLLSLQQFSDLAVQQNNEYSEYLSRKIKQCLRCNQVWIKEGGADQAKIQCCSPSPHSRFSRQRTEDQIIIFKFDAIMKTHEIIDFIYQFEDYTVTACLFKERDQWYSYEANENEEDKFGEFGCGKFERWNKMCPIKDLFKILIEPQLFNLPEITEEDLQNLIYRYY